MSFSPIALQLRRPLPRRMFRQNSLPRRFSHRQPLFLGKLAKQRSVSSAPVEINTSLPMSNNVSNPSHQSLITGNAARAGFKQAHAGRIAGPLHRVAGDVEREALRAVESRVLTRGQMNRSRHVGRPLDRLRDTCGPATVKRPSRPCRAGSSIRLLATGCRSSL